jgi:mRNA interferase RelE/StbE
LVWTIEFSEDAKKELAKLDRQIVVRITKFLSQRLARLDDPRSIGQALKGSKFGSFWKYRVGDYRLIAHIEDERVCILVLKVGNRKDVYR